MLIETEKFEMETSIGLFLSVSLTDTSLIFKTTAHFKETTKATERDLIPTACKH